MAENGKGKKQTQTNEKYSETSSQHRTEYGIFKKSVHENKDNVIKTQDTTKNDDED